MAHSSLLPLLSLLSLLTTIVCQTPEVVSIAYTRRDSVYRPTQVMLSCTTNRVFNHNNFFFFRNISGHIDRVVVNTSAFAQLPGRQQMMLNFDVTPEIEGVYSCVNNNVTSINSVELIAFPIPDPTISLNHTAHIGSTAVINCPFRAGALVHRYQASWSKGLRKISPRLSNGKYQVLRNLSLVITDVNVSDASKGYYCSVTVDDLNDVFHQEAPSVELEVYDQLRVTQGIQDVVQKLGSTTPTTFTCNVSGVPQPEIRWIHKGVELTNQRGSGQEVSVSVRKSSGGIVVTSALEFRRLEEEDTGGVQCVGYHVVGGGVRMAASKANLIVLPEGFPVHIQPLTEGGVQIRASLPAVIPTMFVLVVRFLYNEFTIIEVNLLDTSFIDTRDIQYNIPREKMPPFTSFRVLAALRVNGVQSGFSEQSNIITLNESPPTVAPVEDCECPTTDLPNQSQQTLLTIIIIIVVLIFIIGLVAAIALVSCLYFHHYQKKQASAVIHHSSRQDQYDDYEPDSKCHSRSATPSSYSGSSRSSSRSRSSSGSEEEEEGYVEERPADRQEGQRKYEGEKEKVTVRELSREDAYYIKE